MRRFKSTESLRNRCCQPCKLDLSKASFLNYLNLIDLESKKICVKSIVPWHHIPLSDDVIMRFSSQSVFSAYKEAILNKINNCDLTELSCLIRKLVNVSKMYGIPLEENTCYCLYYNILHSLFDRGLKDSSLLLTIWNTLCISDQLKVAVFSGLIGKLRKQKSAELLDYILKNAFHERFSFWGAWTKNHKLDSFPYCPVTAALLSGNEEQMKVLLKYGFEPNLQRTATYDSYFKLRGNGVYDWLREPLVESTSSRRKCITEVLLFLTKLFYPQSCFKRISIINCFYLLWDVIPTPHVTKTELQNEIRLRFLFPPSCSDYSSFPSTEMEFLGLCDFYDTEEPLQPRSLKHLCKCKIRRELQKSWNLPMGIDSLPLPNHIKEYLHASL